MGSLLKSLKQKHPFRASFRVWIYELFLVKNEKWKASRQLAK